MATALFAAPILPPAGQWFDNSGDPLNGGEVYIYVAGTTTNETSYPTYDDALAGTILKGRSDEDVKGLTTAAGGSAAEPAQAPPDPPPPLLDAGEDT